MDRPSRLAPRRACSAALSHQTGQHEPRLNRKRSRAERSRQISATMVHVREARYGFRVHGSFRRDLELLEGRPPTFRLRRRRGARVLTWGLAAAALAATVLDV